MQPSDVGPENRVSGAGEGLTQFQLPARSSSQRYHYVGRLREGSDDFEALRLAVQKLHSNIDYCPVHCSEPTILQKEVVLADGLTYIHHLLSGYKMKLARSLATNQVLKHLKMLIPGRHFVTAGVPAAARTLIRTGGFTPSHHQFLEASSTYIRELVAENGARQPQTLQYDDPSGVETGFQLQSELTEAADGPMVVSDTEEYLRSVNSLKRRQQKSKSAKKKADRQQKIASRVENLNMRLPKGPGFHSDTSVPRAPKMPKSDAIRDLDRVSTATAAETETLSEKDTRSESQPYLGETKPAGETVETLQPDRMRDSYTMAETRVETETLTERALRKMNQWCDLWLKGDLKGEDDWKTFDDCLDLPD